jgi:glycine reductase
LKLEVGYIKICDIVFADEARVKDGVLYVNAGELEKLVLEDEHLTAVSFDIAKPGESVRITPVKDVIEPRAKVEGPGDIFPGVITKLHTVGSGKTHVLRGAAVVTVGKIVGFQEGIIDMTGPGAEYTPFSTTNNLVADFTPKDDLTAHEYEAAIRKAGLKIAYALGKLGVDIAPDETQTYEFPSLMEAVKNFPDLPRVGYVQMLQSQGLLHDTYVYSHRADGWRDYFRQLRFCLR